MAKLGWIGLGRIGLPMASRLLSAGHEILVYDLDATKIVSMVVNGAVGAACPAEVAAGATTIFTCVIDGKALEDVLFGACGITARASPGTLLIDHTSVHPDECRALAERAQSECGLRMVDAPISGGPARAAEGSLIAWLGGDASDVERTKQLIASYVAKATYMGPSGQGQLSKSCNQFIVASTVALWSQMLRYAAIRGLDPALLIETLEGGAADSPISRVFARPLVDKNVLNGSVRNLTKDLRIIVGDQGGRWPLAEGALDEFETHISPPSKRPLGSAQSGEATAA